MCVCECVCVCVRVCVRGGRGERGLWGKGKLSIHNADHSEATGQISAEHS